MTSDSFLALTCISMIALLFGFVMAFNGYRLFYFLLPIWGFFFGFGLGAQSVQAIFGTGFLADVTSWVVGFVVAIVFAVLSYLFFFVAVAVAGASLGYSLGAGIMLAIGIDFSLLVWLVGIITGAVVMVAVLALNLQKWVIILGTAFGGASIIVGVFLALGGRMPMSELTTNPVQMALSDSPFWLITYLVVAALGAIAQIQTSRRWQIENYNRWDEMTQGA